MTDGYKNCRNEKEFNLYSYLLKTAYEIYKVQNNGMVCGSGAEVIRDELFTHIQSEYLKGA